MALILLLAGCVRLEGEITIDNAGLVTGKLSYALDKSLASQGGINSLEDFKKGATQENNEKICASEKYLETDRELVFECLFSKSSLNTKDSDLKVEKIGDQIIFYFKQTSSGDSSMDLGKTTLSVVFPGPITSIKENKPGIVLKRSETSAYITASGTATLDIAITSSALTPQNKIENTNTDKSYEEMLADWNARETSQKALATKISKNIKIGMKINSKVCKVAWTKPPTNMKMLFMQNSKVLQISRKYYQEFVSSSDAWFQGAGECSNLIDAELARQGKGNQVNSGTISPDLQSKLESFVEQEETLTAELDAMYKTCKVIAKYTEAIQVPKKPNFTGNSPEDAAILAQYQSKVKVYEAQISKIRSVYKSNQCSTAKVSTANSSEEGEEVLDGEEIADYEISGKVISSSSTRITLIATPNTTVTITASKKGVKKKLSFKVKTDANGEKVFRTPSNLKGYTLKLFEAGDEVASVAIN
jgi:hypothetical protein